MGVRAAPASPRARARRARTRTRCSTRSSGSMRKITWPFCTTGAVAVGHQVLDDGAGERREDLVEHLHHLDDEERLAGLEVVALRRPAAAGAAPRARRRCRPSASRSRRRWRPAAARARARAARSRSVVREELREDGREILADARRRGSPSAGRCAARAAAARGRAGSRGAPRRRRARAPRRRRTSARERLAREERRRARRGSRRRCGAPPRRRSACARASTSWSWSQIFSDGGAPGASSMSRKW